jgi:hypothetical protein
MVAQRVLSGTCSALDKSHVHSSHFACGGNVVDARRRDGSSGGQGESARVRLRSGAEFAVTAEAPMPKIPHLNQPFLPPILTPLFVDIALPDLRLVLVSLLELPSNSVSRRFGFQSIRASPPKTFLLMT